MVIRREVLVGEPLADEHGLVAVVEEAGMVAASLDRVVVRVDGLQLETILGDGADERNREDVAAVLVHVVVDVEHVLVRTAVADHVALPHRDDVLAGCSTRVRVLQAAPQTLLFTGEVQEADFDVVRDDEGVERLGDLEDGDRAGQVIIGTRSDLFVAPGIAGGRVEVRAEDVDLLLRARHLAGDLGLEVEVRLAANRVGHASRGDLERAVVLLQRRHRLVDAFTMRAAALDGDALVADVESLFARHTGDQVGQFVFANAGDQLLDERLTRRQVGDVDRRNELMQRPANLSSVELAWTVVAVVVGVNLALVDRMEVSVQRNDGLTVEFVLRGTQTAHDEDSHEYDRGG